MKRVYLENDVVIPKLLFYSNHSLDTILIVSNRLYSKIFFALATPIAYFYLLLSCFSLILVFFTLIIALLFGILSIPVFIGLHDFFVELQTFSTLFHLATFSAFTLTRNSWCIYFYVKICLQRFIWNICHRHSWNTHFVI